MKTFFGLILFSMLFFCAGGAWAEPNPIGPADLNGVPTLYDMSWPADSSSADSTGDFLAALVVQLAGRHPWVLMGLVALGSLRLVVKPIVAGAHRWAEATESRKDDEVLERVERSAGWKAFLFVLDWLGSIKFRSTALLGLIGLMGLMGTGCAFHRAVDVDPKTGGLTSYTDFSFCNNSATKGLAVGKRSRNGASTLLGIQSQDLEANVESIIALQGLLEKGAKGAVEGAK